MAHYAFINNDNIVIEVIPGIDENELIENMHPEDWYSQFRGLRCIRTSYNNNIRYNFAGVGYSYDEINDAFIPPKPYAKWVLNNYFQWEAPKPMPINEFLYNWDDDLGEWVVCNVSA